MATDVSEAVRIPYSASDPVYVRHRYAKVSSARLKRADEVPKHRSSFSVVIRLARIAVRRRRAWATRRPCLQQDVDQRVWATISLVEAGQAA